MEDQLSRQWKSMENSFVTGKSLNNAILQSQKRIPIFTQIEDEFESEALPQLRIMSAHNK
jgi:biopolymer transport protein ExbB/TolQ